MTARTATLPPVPAPLRERRFLLLCGANFLFFFGVAMFHIVARHLRALGAHEAQIGAIMGCFGVAAAVMIPLAGSLTDRFGRRPFVFAGYALTAVAAVGWLLFPRLTPALGVLRLAQGAAFACALVGSATMAIDLAPPGRLAQSIGLFGAAGLLTTAVGPTLAEALSTAYGFRAVFVAAGGIGLLAVLLLAWVPETRVGNAAADATPLLRIALRPGTRAPLLASFLGATGFGAVFTFLADFAPGIGIRRVSPFFLGYTAAALSMRLFAGDLSDRVGRRRVTIPAYVGSAAAIAALAGLASTWQLVALAVGLGLSHGLYYPALNALVLERVEEPLRGKTMALYNLSFNVGVMASSFGYGLLAKAVGYRPMYLCAGASVLLASALLALDRLPETAPT
jgi:MFS family permease